MSSVNFTDTVPTVAGSHMTFLKPNNCVTKIPRDDNFVLGEKCETCGKDDEADALIQCESCDTAYHGACLDPPLKTSPDLEWNCHRCLVGDGQFGFEEGGLYSLRAFQHKAALFKQNYFEKKMPFDAVLNCPRPVTEEDVEAEFWRLVVDLEETVEVEYGADIHCTTHGSGFPTIEKNPKNPYSTDPWNLNILPLHGDSLFRHIKTDISGMTVPWVYVGMTFSTFCWHNEDHYSYSANYQHFGATKTWYGIPGADAEKFEQAMRDAVPELFETQPDLLFQLVTLLPPEHLKKAGVRVYAIDQRAGQFVITFPQAYHAGFNHGFNFNEAVNFAPVDWEPFGLAGVDRLQEFRRQPCFSHEELLWTAAENPSGGGLSIQTAKWLAPALDRIHKREMERRRTFVSKHLETSPHQCKLTIDDDDDDDDNSNNNNDDDGASCPLEFQLEDDTLPEEEYQCVYCKAFSFLSRFKCIKSGKVLCLMHAGSHACCDVPEPERFLGADHILHYRKSDEVINSTYKKVYDKAHTPEAWEERFEKLLDDSGKPSLRLLRNMVHEGEKIPWNLPSLPVLKEFVDRCNEWVEEATMYTLRKQQNRRKSDKTIKKSNSIFEKKDRDVRDVANIHRLLQAAEQIGFDCQEITQLSERLDSIKTFQTGAATALRRKHHAAITEVEDLLEEGRTFNVDLSEVEDLANLLDTLKWSQRAAESRGIFMTMKDVEELVEEGKALKMQPLNDHLKHYSDLMTKGQQWEYKAREVMSAETIHYAQLEALSSQVQLHALPVSQETYNAIDQILHKHREAHKQIIDLMDRSRNPDYRRRPKYTEVTMIMKKLEDLNSKPHGTSDLEREQRRHEDWMRKGKKLFGKSNAPLHILKSHMEYVLERNHDCFDMVHDKPRVPAEPASREPSPDSEGKTNRWEDIRPREVFCICRKTEAGLMIECEVCHEWYHSKCLKIARGKIKDEDKYTCPVCDWRVKIPRDAARPKIEDLVDWGDEIQHLPFQPDEEDLLRQIIEDANEFRQQIHGFCTPMLSTKAESDAQRFYLRKMEGAEILLAWETNFFRQELHKWCPVAPQAPPVQDVSKSTRKPRPTKLQRILTEHRVNDVDELPETVRAKAQALKRKQQNQEAAAAAAATAAAIVAASVAGSGTTVPSSGTVATSPFVGPYGHQVLVPRQSLPGMGVYPPQERRISTSPSDTSMRDETSELDPAMANNMSMLPSLLHGHGHVHGHSQGHDHTHGHTHGHAHPHQHQHQHPHIHAHPHPRPHSHGLQLGLGLGLGHELGHELEQRYNGPGEHAQQQAHSRPRGMSQMLVDTQSLPLEERLLRGQEDGTGLDLESEEGRARALDMLSRTDTGRRRAMEIFGPDVWGPGSGHAVGGDMRAVPTDMKAVSGAGAAIEDEGEVDKMFTEMTNQDDEEKRS